VVAFPNPEQAKDSRWTNPVVPSATIPEGVHQLPVAIDGSQTPELIPDAVAYRLFVSAVSVAGAKPSSAELDRRDALLSSVGLSADDHSRFVAATHHVKDEVGAIEAARRQLAARLPEPPAQLDQRFVAQLDDLKTRHRVLLNNAVRSATEALTPEGRMQFDRFIREHVKRHIVIYGAPPLADE
jgi:hypothetical protein